MYIVTFKQRPIRLRDIFIIERQPEKKIFAAPDKIIMSNARHEVIKEFFKLVGHGWHHRHESITMHQFNDYGRLIEDVTDSRAWRERKEKKMEAKRIAAKVRKSRLY